MNHLSNLAKLLELKNKEVLYSKKYLDLYAMDITDVNFISTLNQLSILNICNNNISSLKPIKYLSYLTELYMRNNPIILSDNDQNSI